MILEAADITKWFGEGEGKTYALKNVSFNVEYGEMLFIIGPSGSGKTTLLSIISGILRPNEGEIVIEENKIWQLSNDQLANFRLYHIGFVFQDFHLFNKLTATENVAIPLILQKVSWEKAVNAAIEALEIVGLKHRMDLHPNKLSIGEQQRIAIARAIVTKPDLLIFDEPTASLDGETGKKILSFIKENILTKDRAIIVVTHDNRIYNFASRIIRLEDGKLMEQPGMPNED